MIARPDNPFRITKSNDLTDAQIEELWVSVTEDDGVTGLARPASRTAMYILGGKGSGKSHLMRYYSFPVRLIRYRKGGRPIAEGMAADGYVGIYARCGSMDSSRFQGKGLTEDVWEALFAYYFELWIADKTLAVIANLIDEGVIGAEVNSEIGYAIASLLDKEIPGLDSVAAVRACFARLRKDLDFAVNNAAFVNKVDAQILLTRGALFFGIPRILCERVDALNDVVFLYLFDEFENFSERRQVFVNSLVRDRDGPVAFKIGARLYGRRTLTTSGGERNLQGSEYEDLFLDERFRNSQERYTQFALKLIARRLEPKHEFLSRGAEEYGHLYEFFEEPELDWNSLYFSDYVKGHGTAEGPHILSLRDKLVQGLKDGLVVGPKCEDEINDIISAISFRDFPILEKLCILHLFQKWYRRADLMVEAQYIHDRALAKLAGRKDEKFDEFVKKHKSDMIAQWLRENGQKQFGYAGLRNFIRMSEGLPRTLITILKHVHDWATFLNEAPFVQGKISKEAQQRGVAEASDLFLEQMLPEGEEAIKVGIAIERLCELFRTSRFSDKPVETSLMAFSVDQFSLDPEAMAVLELANRTSLIIPLQGGQKERNSMGVTKKYEINAMLAPRRDLPIARRGIVSFKAAELEAVLIASRHSEFEELRKSWERKMTAPTFGRVNVREKEQPRQDLFG